MQKRAVLVPIVVLVMAAVLFLLVRRFWTDGETSAVIQRTDDAYVKAEEIPLSTRVSGTVRTVQIGDFQRVKSGQLLVEIADDDYQAAVREATSGLEAVKAEYSANQNAKLAADANVKVAQSAIDQARSAQLSAKAALEASEATLTQANSELIRQKALLAERAATKQQLEQIQASQSNAQAGLDSHKADLARTVAATSAAEAALTGAIQQRKALDAKDESLRAQTAARQAAITVALVNLGYTRILAPSDGTVGTFRVHPGQLIGAGSQIVPLVQSGVWIEANFRETQLRRVKVGNRVEIRIDALPSKTFHGHVDQVAPASGSQFALLPPDNATGNYTKVVQRIPVRIVLDDDPLLSALRPGFSAEVAIDTSSVTEGSPSVAAGISE